MTIPETQAQTLIARWMDRSLPLEEFLTVDHRQWLLDSLRHDIAQALREAEARFAGELEAYCFTMMKRMEDQLSAYNNVIMWCRERAQRVREGTP